MTPRRPEPVPDLDREPSRIAELGEAVVGLWSELVESLPERPVNWTFDPERVRERLALPVPDEPLTAEQLTEHLRELAFEQAVYIGHPGFLAYVVGAGTAPGPAADLGCAATRRCSTASTSG